MKDNHATTKSVRKWTKKKIMSSKITKLENNGQTCVLSKTYEQKNWFNLILIALE
jgi:hypothetical protein